MAHSFHMHSSHRHFVWSQHLKPALTVPSGAEITFDLVDGGNNQVNPSTAAAGTALTGFIFSQTDPAVGPVFIEGTEPGDVLKVEVLALETAPYGWTAIFSGFGLLADEFPEQHLKMWDLSEGGLLPDPIRSSSSSNNDSSGTEPSPFRRAVFKPGISIPVRPFLGVVGVAPPSPDADLPTIPPHAMVGGNVDCRDLSRVGCTLYLPVNVPGALFSCGDGHAAQGDGEVCGTAIETPMKATLRLTVEKKGVPGSGWRQLLCPHYVVPPRGKLEREVDAGNDRGEYAVLGIHEDAREAARMAVRGLLDWLEAEKGLTRVEAYMLASVAASLRMSEVVDMPNYAVSCALPLSVFDE